LSGIAALIYQVVWFKQLSYFLGNTTYSQSIVLATYMGGLALGAWYWGKKADSFKNTLLLFAVLEIALSIYCFCYVPIFSFIEKNFITIVASNNWSSDSYTVLLIKFFVSGSTILLPTFLMGGTLPVLVKFLSSKLDEVGKNVSVLYFINSLGAVIGTVLSGLYLIQTFGLLKTTYFAASVELLVGLTSLYLSRHIVDPPKNESAETKRKSGKKDFLISEGQLKLVLRIAALSGFSAMAYEVVWLRLLIPILSSSTYSFTLILAAFISGITLGSYLTYRYHSRIKNPLLFVGNCQFAIVISIFLTLPLYEYLPYEIWKAASGPPQLPHDYSYYLFIQFTFVFLALVIPTIFMGMSLPVLSRVAVDKVEDSGKTIGKIFALNTLGTVLGALVAGLFLIPAFGILTTIIIALAINLFLSFAVYLQKDFISLRYKTALGSLLLICGIFFFRNVKAESWAYPIMLSQVPREINRHAPPATYKEFISTIKKGNKILYYKEGIGGTIVVGVNKNQIYLSTNGKADANSVTDLRTQVSLGLTPVILHPKAERVFVIGYGAGTTIGYAMTHPNVKHAEVAEISAEVIEASQHFKGINEQPLKRKNLKVIKDDGVSALRLSSNKYDVIISQPSNPWSAGVGNLFTKEFFSDCKDKLNPGGYVAQWFSYYEMDDRSLKLILRTALGEFKHVSLWHIGTSDILLLCSETPFNFNLETIENNYNAVADKLGNINIHTFSTFLSQQLTSSTKGIHDYASTGPINTEDHPLLELWAPKAFYYNSEPAEFVVLDERKKFESSSLLLKSYMQQNGGLTQNEVLQTGLFQSIGGCKELAFYMADLNPEIYMMWYRKALDAGDKIRAQEYLDLASAKGVIEKDIVQKEGGVASAKEPISGLNQSSGSSDLYYQNGTLLLNSNQLEGAAAAFEKAIELNSKNIDAYINLAIVRGKQQNYKTVISILDKANLISDNNAKVFFNRGYAKGFINDFEGAVKDFSKVLELDPNNGQTYVLRGRAYSAMGKLTEACADFSKARAMNVPGALESLRQFCQ
jgi:predicted membrane-bound spermidine synthase/tetratricopeptide (TPR) repeat protein